MITQSQLNIFAGKLKNLVNIAQQDKDKYGATGGYAATAVNFYQHAAIAYDTIQSVINWLNTGSDNNPEITNYVEAYSIKNWMMSNIIPQLATAHHWAVLSAVHHNSKFASCGKEESLRLLTEAVNLLYCAGRCYTEAYTNIPPPDCK
jgi:hypothetical protein